MAEKLFKVKCVPVKNCFCYLSQKNAKEYKNKHIKITCNNEDIYLFVNYIENLVKDDYIGINNLYAQALGLKENDLVSIFFIDNLPTINSLKMSACSKDDHDILELLAEHVQSSLLNQCRVICNNQKLVIWIGGVYITVFVYDVQPRSPGLLENFTEVHILPPNSIYNFNSDYTIREKSFFSSFFHTNDNKKAVEPKKIDIFDEFSKISDNETIFRLVPLSELPRNNEFRGFHSPFTVFAFKKTFLNYPKNYSLLDNPNVCSLLLLTPNVELQKLIYVTLILLDDLIDNFAIDTITNDNLFINDDILNQFEWQIGAKVLLEPYINIPQINQIEIYTKEIFTKNILEKFKIYLGKLCETHEFVLNKDIVFEIGDNLRCFVRFKERDDKFCLITSDFIRECDYTVNVENLPIKKFKNQLNNEQFLINICNYQQIIDDCLLIIDIIKNFSNFNGNILIEGATGTGKTTILKLIELNLIKSPYFMYTKYINCKNIKKKSLESLHKLLTNLFFDLMQHQPSALFIDDLNVLCEEVSENDAVSQQSMYFNNVSELFYLIINDFCTNNKIIVYATTESKLKLNKNIFNITQHNLFNYVYSINNLEQVCRYKILEFLFSNYKLDEKINLDTWSNTTEGFTIQDLIDFTNKSIYESYVENLNPLTITEENCQTAFKNTEILALLDVKFHSVRDTDLCDIGGLNHVKEIITEMIIWPKLYPKIFNKSPIRLSSGMLLYGAPGTGKTILAEAVARHCNLKLIVVKGPELLSKYIGASEQAVRDIFQKAEKAKPCMLFFDEFDSLAPRRGHDNTGVTDRVVNQFLTQLDGVEGLQGVYVIAATSRPDLLDPALLRPGRLDRKVFFNLPNKEERIEIFKIFTKSLDLSSDVNFEEIAEKCDGFTGADIKSIVYTVQMNLLDNIMEIDEKSTHSKISQKNLIEALKATRPSLSKNDIFKFKKIYEQFQGRGKDTLVVPGSRATLA